MYLVNLDLVLSYVPPMDKDGEGMRLTRSFELPFPPSEDTTVFSKEWEGFAEGEPLGYRLKEVTWDIDKGAFFAEISTSVTGVPIALIPFEIRNLLDYGWRYGSYKDAYDPERRRGRKRKKRPLLSISNDIDDEVAESWESASGKSRPKEFKTILHAVVRTMVELRNNEGVAYAMMKTSSYVSVHEDRFGRELTPQQKKFSSATEDYEKLTYEQRRKWCDHVLLRYPRLIDIAEALD